MSAGKAEVSQQVETKIETERRRLMRASAVLTCLAVAVDEGTQFDISDVVTAARDMVASAVNALDSVELARDSAPSEGLEERKPGDQGAASPALSDLVTRLSDTLGMMEVAVRSLDTIDSEAGAEILVLERAIGEFKEIYTRMEVFL